MLESHLEAIYHSSFSQTEVLKNNMFRETQMVNRFCLRTSYIFHLDAIVFRSPIGHSRWGKKKLVRAERLTHKRDNANSQEGARLGHVGRR